MYYIYIMTNPLNTVLYVGMTNNLLRRVSQHRQKCIEGFTKKYNVTKLVYYEIAENFRSAVKREKQIKAGSRKNKMLLVNRVNPDWKDLYPNWSERQIASSAVADSQ